MAYVEWLRVRSALKWTAVVLGVLLAIALVIRVAAGGAQHSLMTTMLEHSHDHDSKVSDVIQPDGSRVVTIDNARKQTHVKIVDRGWNGMHVELYEPHPTSHPYDPEVSDGGSVHVVTVPVGTGSLTIVDTDGTTGFFNFAMGGMLLGLILATILGAPFSRENDGHLEAAFTKPVDRTVLALQTLGIDVAGIAACVALGILFSIVAQSFFELPHVTFGANDAIGTVMAVLLPVAFYAMLTAATASMKRGYGAVIGFAWPVALLVLIFSMIPPGDNMVLSVVHDVAWVLGFINPLNYADINSQAQTVDSYQLIGSAWLRNLPVLALLAVGYSALAVFQWRRVEA